MDKAIALALVVLLAGCATPRLEAIKRQDTVSVVHQPAAQATTIGITDQALGSHAGGGAMGGLVAGAALSISCGPFIPACLPALMAMGSAVGAVGGAAVGYVRGIPLEQHRDLERRLVAYASAQDLGANLAGVIRETGAPFWTEATAEPDIAIAVRHEQAALKTGTDDSVRLYVRATVTVRRRGKAEGEAKAFEYFGLPSGVRSWIDDPDLAAESFLHAHRHIANSLVNELAR